MSEVYLIQLLRLNWRSEFSKSVNRIVAWFNRWRLGTAACTILISWYLMIDDFCGEPGVLSNQQGQWTSQPLDDWSWRGMFKRVQRWETPMNKLGTPMKPLCSKRLINENDSILGWFEGTPMNMTGPQGFLRRPRPRSHMILYKFPGSHMELLWRVLHHWG